MSHQARMFCSTLLILTFDVDSGKDVLERCSVQQVTNFFLRLGEKHQRGSDNNAGAKTQKTFCWLRVWCVPIGVGVSYQALLAQQAEQQSVAHLPQVLEAHGLQLSVLHDVFQLVVEELQDSCKNTAECRWTSAAGSAAVCVILILCDQSWTVFMWQGWNNRHSMSLKRLCFLRRLMWYYEQKWLLSRGIAVMTQYFPLALQSFN